MGRSCMLSLFFLLFYILYQVDCRPLKYKTKWLTQNVDHFSYGSAVNDTFKQRYLVSDKWWDSKHGPIFFYTGNEGAIEGFWNSAGFLFDIAPKYRALVVFAEHRYYGKSLPYGPKKSFKRKYIKYLTVQQALADFALLIAKLRGGNEKRAVVVFGGSYGGILSAWFRVLYPHLADGAIAASAPVFSVTGVSSEQYFFTDVTTDFVNCDAKVKEAFRQLQHFPCSELQSKFSLCAPITSQSDLIHLEGWVRNSFTNLAMFNYPYAVTSPAVLPSWPVYRACAFVSNSVDLLRGLARAAQLYYGSRKCYDIHTEFVQCADPTGCGLGSDSVAWDFQACSQLIMPETSNNRTDMFPVLPFSIGQLNKYCMAKWGVRPNSDRSWMLPAIDHRSSNIVFSNGALDPWHRGGVLANISQTLVAVLITDGAHHYDLRSSNPEDTPSVKSARKFHQYFISKWICDKNYFYGLKLRLNCDMLLSFNSVNIL